MKFILTLFGAICVANAAVAHPGHLAEVAGHGHWLGAAALGAAIALGAWQALKGRKERDEDSEEIEAEDELQEA